MPEWLTMENVIAVVTAIVTVASVVASITPSNADNALIQKILDIVNALGVNIAKAANSDDSRVL